uniref:HicB-like antitoxin of toxin-antitoxin system domain-containing protein n=1 Tax=Cyanothece sp. (strain PCC 7425 / ATCC 29141) TaxID=395961 RepID=B8HMY1_CYAP4
MTQTKYQMLIQWSDSDCCYVVSLPDFPELRQPCTDGETYEEAARHGHELIESLILWYGQEGKPLPHPQTLQPV